MRKNGFDFFLIRKKKTDLILVLVTGWKWEHHEQHTVYKTSEVSFTVWQTTSSKNITSFYCLMQNRVYWATCPWVTMFVKLSHATYHVLNPILTPRGSNSQAPFTMWRTWNYHLPWNVPMLTWCWDLGKIKRNDLQHWHSFIFSSYFHTGVDLFFPLSSPARAKLSWFLQTESLSHLVIPSVSTLQFTLHEYQVADAVLPNSKYSGKSFTGSPQSVNIWSV